MVKLLMMAVVLGGLLNYALYLKTGESPLKNIQWGMPKVKLPEVTMPDISLPEFGSGEGEVATVYKWVDEHGVINYSQTKPEGVSQFDTMAVDPNTNLVQGDPLPEPTPEPVKKTEAVQQPSLPDMNLLPTPDRVKKLMDDAKNIQVQMNERTQLLEDAIKNSGAK